MQSPARAGRIQPEIPGTLCKRPPGPVGIVVPSPLHAQLVVSEIIVGRQLAYRIFPANVRFSVCRHPLSVLSYLGPTVFPGNRLQVRQAAVGAAVGEKHRPPLSCLCLHQRSLMDVAVVYEFLLLVRAVYVL